MTELRYLPDEDDITGFEADVEKAEEGKIVLDGTYFYPEGGGQPADHGTLFWDGGSADVVDVQKDGSEVEHYLENVKGELPSEGEAVHGAIDEGRREKHRRMHTAQHVVSKVVLDEFDASTDGNQIHADRSRIDFELDSLSEEEIELIERRTNDVIQQDLDVEKTNMAREKAEEETPYGRGLLDLIPDHVDPLRMVRIDDFDLCPCGGTHVDHLQEIGKVRIINVESRGAGTTRIAFELEETA